MNKMHILLRQLQLENELSTLMDASINKVTVNQDDCYRFFLQSEKCIPFDEFIRFEKGMTLFPYEASFEFDVSEKLYLKEEVVKYAKYLSLKLVDQQPQFSYITQLPLEYDKDTLMYKVVNEIQLRTITTFTKQLQNDLYRYGFDIHVKAEIDEENDDYKKIKEEMETQPEIVFEQPLIKEEVKPVQKQPFFRRQKNEYPLISLNEVKQDVQYVTIRGFIFKTDMTKTMINNYVKKGVVSPPIKKKYTKEHLAHLIVVSFLKMIYSMEEITLLLAFQIHSCDIGRTYDYFCDELERCLVSTFTNEPITHAKSHINDPFAVYALQVTIRSVVDKIYVLQSMEKMKKRMGGEE